MFKIIPLSRYRRLANSVLRLSNQKRFFPVFLNTEVEIPSGKRKKLVPFFMKTVADILKENPEFAILNSVLDRSWWRNRVIVFDDLSFSLAVEKPFEGELVVAISVLHDLMKKSLHQIEEEYEKIARTPLEEFPLFRKMSRLLWLPDFLHGPLFALVAAFFPRDYSSYGSMGLSNLGKGPIQSFFPSTSKTVIIGLGGVRERDGRFLLTINLVFNHFVVDGRICSRFLERIKNKIEQ